MTNENKKTSDQLIFVHIFRKKHFKTNLENFMTESLNATSTPLMLVTIQNLNEYYHVFSRRDLISRARIFYNDFENVFSAPK